MQSRISEAVSAAFRKAHGVPPSGPGPHPASAYGYPLPPASHPAALSFAKSVLRRAPQNTTHDPELVAKQVRRAKRMISAKRNEAVATLQALTGVRAAVARRAKESSAPTAARESDQKLVATTELVLREAEDDGTVKGVLLIRSGPGNLGDRHYYSEAALQAAVKSGVFEGAKCFVDHPTPIEEEQQPGRTVRALGGWYSDVVARPYRDPELGECVGLFADFHPQVGSEEVLNLVRTCAEYAKRYPTKAYVGLSISALGSGEPDEINGEPWHRVDEIASVQSVDIVTQAGAGGSFLPLKESYRMAKTSTKKSDGIAVKLDSAKLAESVRAEVKPRILKLVESMTGAKVTPEQDAAIDGDLGVVDGGKMDNLIDAATGADEDTEDALGEGDEMDEEMDEADDATPFAADKAKSPELHAAFTKLSAKHEKMKSAMAESAKIAESATSRVARIKRENDVDRILAEGDYPENFRPRMRRELVECGAKNATELKERAVEFDRAYIRPHLDGAGVTNLRESASTGKKPAYDFTFEEAI